MVFNLRTTLETCLKKPVTKTILKNISEMFVELEVYNYEIIDYIRRARLESFDWLNLSRLTLSLSNGTLDK